MFKLKVRFFLGIFGVRRGVKEIIFPGKNIICTPFCIN
jgi:hypothetical protein